MKPLRIATLYRVSTKKQVKSSARKKAVKRSIQESIDDDLPLQRKACESYIANKAGEGWVHTGIEYIEGGVSAFKTHMSRRKVLTRAMEDARAGRYDVLLVYKLDRFGRRSSESLEYAKQFLRYCRIWVVDKNAEFKQQGSIDELMNFVEFWSAKKASEDTKIRVTDRMRQIHQEGLWTGGNPPYGYRCSAEFVNMLEVIPEEAVVVRQIFHKFVYEGFGYRRLAGWLNEQSYKPREAPFWKAPNLHKVIRNPIYKGHLSYGKSKNVEREFATYQDRVDESKWSISEKKWAEYQIIDDETWERAQKERQTRKRSTPDKSEKAMPTRTGMGKLMFVGRCFCGYCGGPMVSWTETSRWKTIDGQTHSNPRPVYKCLNRTRAGRSVCDGEKVSITAAKLEAVIMKRIGEYMQELARSSLLTQVREYMSQSQSYARKELETVLAEIRDYTVMRDNAKAMLKEILMGRQTKFTAEMVSEMLDEAAKKLDELTRRKQELSASVSGEAMSQQQLTDLSTLMADWDRIMAGAPESVRKQMMLEVVSKVVVKKSQVSLTVNLGINEVYEALVGARLQVSAALEDGKPLQYSGVDWGANGGPCVNHRPRHHGGAALAVPGTEGVLPAL